MRLDRCAPPKPPRGSGVLEREQRKAERATTEKREKAATKALDSWTCRWPEKHVCRGGLEAAHVRDASLGGAMDRRNLITICAWLHRRGPESIHGKQLRIEPETKYGTRGACSFWRKGEDGVFYLVAREIRPGQVEKD